MSALARALRPQPRPAASWPAAPRRGILAPPMAAFPPPDADAVLPAPGQGDFFVSRTWYACVAAHALPPGARAEAAAAHGLWLALRREGARLASLTVPYSQSWAPLAAPGADWRAAGRALAALWRGRPPGMLDTMDPATPGLEAFLEGLREGGLRVLRHDHVGSWHQAWPAGLDWEGYLAERPARLRNTIRRRLERAAGTLRAEILAAPGPALEAGIAAFEAVRARSWKPAEPFPAFDAALMRAAAALGQLRLGVLRRAGCGSPVAAQYWILDHGGRRALLPKLFHDEGAREASPGTVLTAHMIRHLIEADGVRALDFGRGDDPYKRLWVAERRQRIGVVLADPRHPAGALAILRHHAGRARRRLLAGRA